MQIDKAEVTDFASFVQEKTQFNWHQDFQSLSQWSVEHMPKFWDLLWDWYGIIGDKGYHSCQPKKMPGAEFFPDAQINFTENLRQMLMIDWLFLHMVKMAASPAFPAPS